MSSQHVLIIGAGVCGLAIAHDLGDRLEVDAVVDPYADYTKYPNDVVGIYDGVDGQLVSELPTSGIRVSRRKLRALCIEQLSVQFDHKLQSIEHREGCVTAVFSNGTKHDGTLLVGADGARSLVRAHLFPNNYANTPLDVVYTNVSFRYQDAAKALFVRKGTPVTTIVIHPESMALISVQNVQDYHRPETWAFQLAFMWRGLRKGDETSEKVRAEVRERAQKLPEPFRSANLWIPSDIELRYYELGYWEPPTTLWESHGGRVTLAGDAAHSMPPHRGQGLNNALNDAYNLVEAVKKLTSNNQSQVLQDYALEVAQRGAKEVQLSRSIAETTMNYTNFRESPLFSQGLRRNE